MRLAQKVNCGGTTNSVHTLARDVQCIRWGIGADGKHCVPKGGQLQVEQVATHRLMPYSNIPDPWRTYRPWFTDMMLAYCSAQVRGGIPTDLVDPADQQTRMGQPTATLVANSRTPFVWIAWLALCPAN